MLREVAEKSKTLLGLEIEGRVLYFIFCLDMAKEYVSRK